MSVYIETLAVILVLSSYSIIHSVKGANIICSKSEYVTSGIEFKKCQDETLHSFEPPTRGARGKKYRKFKNNISGPISRLQEPDWQLLL